MIKELIKIISALISIGGEIVREARKSKDKNNARKIRKAIKNRDLDTLRKLVFK